MDLLRSHYFCTDTNWIDYPTYDATTVVDIERYVCYDLKIHHKDQLFEEDWLSCVEYTRVLNKERHEANKEFFSNVIYGRVPEEELMNMSSEDCPTPTAKVLEWLEANVKPLPSGMPGWCMGSLDYRNHSKSRLSFWFHRVADGKKFIKNLSVHKRPTSVRDYFKGTKKRLVNDKMVEY